MTGAIFGDIVGSRFEYHNIHTKKFCLLAPFCHITDDSVLTMAVAKALVISKPDFSDLADNTISCLREFGRRKFAAYGKMFFNWLHSENPEPYNEECKTLARIVTAVTHNHPEGIKGGEAIAVCVFLAGTGKSKDEIRDFVNQNYYKLDFTLDDLYGAYQWSSTCQGSVPQAIECFLESTSFVDAIRNAISIGGDSDTIAAMTGAIAEAFYGMPKYLRTVAGLYCPRCMFKYVKILNQKLHR